MLVKAEARKEESSYDPSLVAIEGSAGDVEVESDGVGIVILKRRASTRDLRIRESMLPLAPTRATF
jgi:hypothetical protein